MWKQDKEEVVAREPPKMIIIPGPGLHLLLFNKKPILLNRIITEGSSNDVLNNGVANNKTEIIQLITYGRNINRIKELLMEAMKYSIEEDRDQTIIYQIDRTYGSSWQRAVTRPLRLMESVILDNSVNIDLYKDAKDFFSSTEWYRKLGIPYRRTYLLYGPPGCGKTSFVSVLAGKLHLNVCVLCLSDKNMNDIVLLQSLNDAPSNSIILLEDIDAAFPKNKSDDNGNNNNDSNKDFYGGPMLTFSGLLNALDGIASQEGRIFVLTTNHIEVLPKSLIRPGRVDRVVQFKLANVTQIQQMFTRFYPNEQELAHLFAQQIGDYKVSMAQLQGHFLLYKDDPLSALKHVLSLLENIN